MNKYLTLDIGGTFIKYGIFDSGGRQYYSAKEATCRKSEEFLAQLLGIVGKSEAIDRLKGIAISIAGFINPETGENNDFSVGKNFVAYNLKKELKHHTGYDVSIENDANCAALAELWLGAAKGALDIVTITLGTGIGGAIISKGRLIRGKGFKAGEFGLMYCYREKQGEGYRLRSPFATSTLVKKVSEALGFKIQGEYIFNNLDNEIIKQIYENWIEDIALIIGNIAIAFDPEKILIGGGVSEQKVLISSLRDKVYELYPHLGGDIAVEACALKNNAGMLGALYHYLREYPEG